MPLELFDVEDLKDYCDNFPEVPIFYEKDEPFCVISAGKVAWRGKLNNDEMGNLEDWLLARGAKLVKGYRDLEELFS